MPSDQSLVSRTATEIVDLLTLGAITPLECLEALETRIANVDPRVNALPTLAFEQARAHAKALTEKPVKERGRLAGLPVAIKDLNDVAGVRTTYGSPIFKNHVPTKNDIMVDTIEHEGGVIYAKTNTPEFGAGANTFNEVFGRTLNPWNTKLSAAGSSGGSAVALKTGMAWLAHGSDMGGSLRTPAGFCGVVGMRPSPGRVAHNPSNMVDSLLFIEGPMARNVEDLALFLDAMTGESPRDPISLPRTSQRYLAAARSGPKPVRVAYSKDLGITPIDPEIAEICEKAALRFRDAGVLVEEAHPDVSDAHECFGILRAAAFAAMHADNLKNHRDLLKPEIVWNIEKGLELTMADIVKAEIQRAKMLKSANDFFETYDLLLVPTAIVPPYPVEQRYIEECNGHKFNNYIEWLGIVYAITLTTCPALSLPCGFTKAGLPVGLQVVARPRGEAQVLAGAKILETILNLDLKPIDPR